MHIHFFHFFLKLGLLAFVALLSFWFRKENKK